MLELECENSLNRRREGVVGSFRRKMMEAIDGHDLGTDGSEKN